jgi:hypothetical protein
MPPAGISSLWNVIEFTFGRTDDDSELFVMCKGKCILIQLFADTLSEPLRGQYLFLLRAAANYELDEFTVQDF